MGTALAWLAVLGAVLWLWSDARKQHERAVLAVRLVLRGTTAQLLDDTVALQAVRLARSDSGRLGLARTYAFEVTVDGFERLRGRLTLSRGRTEILELPDLGERQPGAGLAMAPRRPH